MTGSVVVRAQSGSVDGVEDCERAVRSCFDACFGMVEMAHGLARGAGGEDCGCCNDV